MASNGRRGAASDLPFDGTQEEFLASMARFQAAGMVEQVIHDQRTATGVISFTPAMLTLLQAGREPFTEPEFLSAWLTGDPLQVRAWVETEAAAIARGERR